MVSLRVFILKQKGTELCSCDSWHLQCPSFPHHTLSAFMGHNCLLTVGMVRGKTLGLEGYGGEA